MGFSGQVVMVTGAAGTLGRAVAASFAGAGARLVLLDIAAKGLEAAHGSDNDKQLLIAADLGDPKAVAGAVAAATGKFGRIDVLCNVAGGFRMGPPVHETPDELWRAMMDINVGTLLNAVRAVTPVMLAAGSGKIVNIAAMGGVTGRGNMGAYSAAKSVVMRLTESMSAELRDRGINVNCVMPSIIDTPANRADMPNADPKRWVAPEALADVILFLASDKARAVHGAALPVVGLS
jgi:NAD(P)-dependent dehydrogenase (short-subunit alcohol dehydrogenase family)